MSRRRFRCSIFCCKKLGSSRGVALSEFAIILSFLVVLALIPLLRDIVPLMRTWEEASYVSGTLLGLSRDLGIGVVDTRGIRGPETGATISGQLQAYSDDLHALSGHKYCTAALMKPRGNPSPLVGCGLTPKDSSNCQASFVDWRHSDGGPCPGGPITDRASLIAALPPGSVDRAETLYSKSTANLDMFGIAFVSDPAKPRLRKYYSIVRSGYRMIAPLGVPPPAGPPPSGGGGGGGICFTKETLVSLADGRTKPIYAVRTGDQILSFDEKSRQLVTSVVLATKERKHQGIVIVNGEIQATPEHPFFVDGQWVPAQGLKVGDRLTGVDLDRIPVTSITFVRKRVSVFNMTIAEHHNFFAEGVLVHNASKQ